MAISLYYTNQQGVVFENHGPEPEPYINKQGEAVTLNRWCAHCEVCGTPYFVLFTDRLSPGLGCGYGLRRSRCEVHKGRWGERNQP
jgi:hypothetical protein